MRLRDDPAAWAPACAQRPKLCTASQNRRPGQPFKCRECGSPEVTLFAIESRAELGEIQRALGAKGVRSTAP